MWAKASWGLLNLDNVQFFYTNKTSNDVEIVAFFVSSVTKVVKRVNTEEEAQDFLKNLHSHIQYNEAMDSIT